MHPSGMAALSTTNLTLILSGNYANAKARTGKAGRSSVYLTGEASDAVGAFYYSNPPRQSSGTTRGKRGKARDLLAPLCGWFTEGLDTRDRKEAKAQLEEPRRRTSRRVWWRGVAEIRSLFFRGDTNYQRENSNE
jgi:hypothetical protein